MKNVKVILIGVALCAAVFANQRIDALGGDSGFWPGDKDNIKNWHNVKNGTYSKNEAEFIFDNYFEGSKVFRGMV